jgi:hypothetical protein
VVSEMDVGARGDSVFLSPWREPFGSCLAGVEDPQTSGRSRPGAPHGPVGRMGVWEDKVEDPAIGVNRMVHPIGGGEGESQQSFSASTINNASPSLKSLKS